MMFLFHIGAIKRQADNFCLHPFRRFYSTLVRLKVKQNLSIELSRSCFYSTLVRLKERTVQNKLKNNKCFYSTLVRLKELQLTWEDFVEFQTFLFHIGAIKSAWLRNYWEERYKFLFHIGAIKSGSYPG